MGTAYKSGWNWLNGKGSRQQWWTDATHQPGALYVGNSWDAGDYNGVATKAGIAIGITAQIAVPIVGGANAVRGVAAGAGGAEELTTVGRWMGDGELAQMTATARVVEAGSDGRTFVVNPADPAAFPAGTGNFVEFRVPTSSLKPAGKPEWNVIPGPNITTTRFGPPPAEMPPATCIVVVCTR
jgi:hypothetical protein